MEIFHNTQIAFKNRSDSDLKKARILFRLMGYPFLTGLTALLAKIALRLRIPIGWIVKPTVFRLFCGGETLNEAKAVVDRLATQNVRSVADFAAENRESEEEIRQVINEITASMDFAKANQAVPFSVFKPTAIAPPGALEEAGSAGDKSPQVEKFRENFRYLCHYASERGIPVMVDAEECHYQQIIDDLCTRMMELYNKDRAIVFNTLQMYRHDRLDYLKQAIGRAREKQYYTGFKLVRGAYMDQERERAGKMGYPSPIHPDKESTDRAFNDAVVMCLDNIDITSLFAGTHNEESLLLLMERMKAANIQNDDPRIYSSQLYGMSDHISFNMAAHDYNVAKYLPYGPIRYLIPYLIRRAEENRSVAGQSGRELHYINLEARRRKKHS